MLAASSVLGSRLNDLFLFLHPPSFRLERHKSVMLQKGSKLNKLRGMSYIRASTALAQKLLYVQISLKYVHLPPPHPVCIQSFDLKRQKSSDK